MASALERAPPVQQIQYAPKRFLAPLPLSLFGELEDESIASLDEHSASAPSKPTSSPATVTTVISTTSSTSPADIVNGDDDDEFGDFESEFGDFESVPAGTSTVVTDSTSVASDLPALNLGQPNLHLPHGAQGNGKPVEVISEFETDFGAVAPAFSPASAPATTLSRSRLVVEEDLFGNFEVGSGMPKSEGRHSNGPVFNLFANFESSSISQPTKIVTKNPAQETHNLFDDFSSLSVNGTHHVEQSTATAKSVDGFEGFGALRTVQIEPSAAPKSSVSLFDDFGSDTFFDVPKRGPMNGFEDLFGDFEAPSLVTTQPSWSFANEFPDKSSEMKPKNNVSNCFDHLVFDPLGALQLDCSADKSDSPDVIFFSPKAQAHVQETGGESDDDWGDFVAPPPPVSVVPKPETTETTSNDLFTLGVKDSRNGDFGDLSLPGNRSQPQEQTHFPDFIDAWETDLVDSGTAKSNSNNGESTVASQAETTSQASAPAAPVKVDAFSFYEAQVSQFFPTTGSAKPDENGTSLGPDSRRSRSVDLDALYASPVVVKKHTRGKSYVEHSAAPLSLSLFGEEEDAAVAAAELSLGSSLSDFVGMGRHLDAVSGDEFPGGVSSSSDSQEDDVDADEFFLASADDLHKLTLWLLEEGRVQEALACTKHTAALLEFQALQEDCSRALESGDKEKASVITTKIEAAHAKLVKPQEWHRWQKRQRHENGLKHGSTLMVPKLTHEDMMSLLGGTSDPRGEYFRSHFQSDEIDSLAKKDLRAAAEQHTRALEAFQLLISATVQEQLLYVKAWSALASSCASELELGMIFWQRAVQAQSQSHLLTHRQGRNYFAALGQVYSVFLVLEATVRLHAPWLEVAGEKGKAVNRLIDECRTCWLGSGLKDAVYWALSDANESLPSTRTSWQGILDLSIAVNIASLKHTKGEVQPVCGLSLLPMKTLSGMASVEWGGRQYYLPLANMWANCVENEPPRLPILGLQQTG
ncbi:hypothetical protein AXG93_4485s1250 [Marchantia polymorpha subsp. ruderalis]|nr:hypothetical protein AXG93_4485s1250 [Marchantia polymorpha subsp. ruderalis]